MEREVGEETGITVRILGRIAWPHDLLVTHTSTFEGGSTVAAYPAKEMNTAMLVANATLAAIKAAEINWDLTRIATTSGTGPRG